ncbi:MAG: HAMP domain-containing histidine kinase [Chloroflexi bacterium]|nr:HAMP domain-containing histidine kinase [Chloroflexota bacterium]
MVSLVQWLQANMEALVDTAVARLSQNEALKSELVESIQAFYDGLLRTLVNGSPLPLNAILIDWVESSSAPAELELSTFVPVLTTLKQVTAEQILSSIPLQQAVSLLMASDMIFTDALIYLTKLEADALLSDMRAQLRKAEAHVKRLDKSKSNFIAVAAHELRTPLTLVEGYADMIANTSWAQTDAQVPLLLDGINSGTRRLRQIINDLIDVSLLDLKLMELHIQPVWLLHILNAAERNVRKVLGSRQVEVVIEQETFPVQPVYADSDRLLQAVEKVLMNAVKYTPDGGQVVLRARELPGFTDIMVMDTGIGIELSNLPHIFDTFSALGDASLHSSGKTKFKGGGPGLGLPIAKGIIEAHGGTIWAESDGYDEVACPGSIFHIMLPMRPVVSGDKMVDVSAMSALQDNDL